MFVIRKSLWLLILAIVFSFSMHAENNLIQNIKIEGNQNVDNNLILSSLVFQVGDFYSEDKASTTIKNLYQLNIFDDISVEKTDNASGCELTIKVVEYPIVDELILKGNKVLKKDKINEISALKKGSFWSPFLEAETIKKLTDEYKKKSFNLAKISFEAEKLESNKVKLTAVFNEGKKIAVKKIIITGNIEMKTKQLLSKMKTKPSSLLRSGQFEQEKFDQDLVDIIAFYNKKGYIDARIISSQVDIVDNKYIQIDINLYEGNKFFIGEITVKGNTRFNNETILSKFKFKKNEVFDLDKFNKQLGNVSSLYYEEGYIYSNFDHELEKIGNKVNVHLSVEENTRAKVHKIIITGNRKSKEKIVRRQLSISPGDFFKQSDIIQSQRNVYNLGFFEPDMKLDYQPINKNGDIDLILNVNDKTSGTANGGVGYNSQDSFVGQFSLSHNNILGNNWAASLKWEFGGATQNFEFDFTNPYLNDTNVLGGFNIYHTRKDWDSFNYQIFTNGGGIRVGYPLKFLNYSRIVAGYSLYSKKYEILDLNDTYSDNLKQLDSLGWQYTSAFSTTISRDSRDNVFFPTSGSQISLYSEIAGGPFGGDFDYFKQIAQVSWFTSTFWKLSLRTKWRFGFIKAYGNSKEIPPDEKFYLGGTGPDGLRGYGDRSIGPIDGGSRELLFSTEYACPVSGDQVVGLLFFDAGNCFNKLEEFNFLKVKKGAGVGVRVQTPFGLMGFDFAHNFERSKWEPHFQFGTTF